MDFYFSIRMRSAFKGQASWPDELSRLSTWIDGQGRQRCLQLHIDIYIYVYGTDGKVTLSSDSFNLGP